jgi:hypothetical protein
MLWMLMILLEGEYIVLYTTFGAVAATQSLAMHKHSPVQVAVESGLHGTHRPCCHTDSGFQTCR